MTKGQQAMAHAMIFPEPEQRGRGNKRKDLEPKDFSAARLSQARTVLATAPDLARGVLNGSETLDKCASAGQPFYAPSTPRGSWVPSPPPRPLIEAPANGISPLQPGWGFHPANRVADSATVNAQLPQASPSTHPRRRQHASS